MSDVLEVITRLSYSVDDTSGLKAVLDNFQKQAAEIERVTKLRAKLQDQIDKGTNPAATAKYKAAVEDLTKRIDNQTTSLTKQVNASKLVQNSLTQELGLIQKLTDKITDLMHAREREKSVSVVAEINRDIQAAQQELKALTTIGDVQAAKGGVLARILGIGTTEGGAAGILRGVFAGFGIGSGFAIITKLTDALIEFGTAEFDTVGQTKKLIEANAALEKSFAGVGDQLVKLNELQTNISVLGQNFTGKAGLEKLLYDQSTEGIKREVEAIKALGIVSGEVFTAEQNQFEASQKLRRDELYNIKEKQQLLEGIVKILKPAQGSAIQPGGLLSDIFSFVNSAGSNSNELEAVTNKIKESLLPKTIQNELIVAAKDAKDKGGNIYDALVAAVKKYQDDIIKVKQEGLNKQAEIDDAAIARQSKLNEEIYQLNKKLSDRLTTLQNENIQKSVAYEEKHQDNLSSLILSNETSREEALRKFDEDKLKERQQLAEKGQTISATTEEKYRQIRLQIISEYNEKELQITQDYIKRQADAENKISDLLISTRASSLNSENGVNSASGTPNLQTILDEQQAHSGLLISKLAEQHEQQLAEARKFNQDTRELEEQQAIEEKYLADKLNREKLDKQLKYYSDVLNLVKEKGQELLLEQLAQGTNQSANAERFLSGNESGGAFKYRSIRANFKDSRNQINTDISNKDKEISQANQNREDIINNPESTAADIAKIDKEINQLIVDKQKLNNQKADLISSEQIRQVNIAVDAFKSLAEIAVQSFNTIAQARDQDLNREISVREQRVSMALKIAEKGNVQVLNLEQKRLDAANQQKRKNALEELSINQALIVSNSILAVVKSAVDAGPLAPVTIIATIAALAAGFAAVKSIDNASKAQFFKGGYTGDGGKYEEAGTVHGGEFVITKEKTAQYRPLLEAIHKGEQFLPLPPMITPQMLPAATGNFASKSEIAELKEAVYSVADAVHGKTVNVSQVMNERGLVQRVEEIKSTERRRWRS